MTEPFHLEREPITLYHAPITRVIINPHTLRKLWAWTCACPCELSALGVATVHDSILYVTDEVFLLKQRGSMAHTDLDMKSVDELHRMRHARHESTEDIRFWFHSHADMSAYFSGTDEDTIKELGAFHPILIAGVFNRRGETRWCLWQSGMTSIIKHQISGPRITQAEVKAAMPLIDANVKREDRWVRDWWDRKQDQGRRDDEWENKAWKSDRDRDNKSHDII